MKKKAFEPIRIPGEGKMKYKCSGQNCKFESINPVNVQDHTYSKHTNELPYQCMLCPENVRKLFSTKSALRSHTFNTHNDKICDICSETVGDLQSHKRSRHDPTRRDCVVKCGFTKKYNQICTEEFKSMKEYQMHRKNAHEHVCPYCSTVNSITFHSHELLVKHVKLHNYKFERGFHYIDCPYCPQQFKTTDSETVRRKPVHRFQSMNNHIKKLHPLKAEK